MTKIDERTRLRHMRDAAIEAMAFAEGRGYADLVRDRQFGLAVVKCIEIIGEAASHITEPTRQRLSAVPWPKIVAMRHRLIHAYYDVNPDTVWATLRDELPILAAQLASFLDSD